MAARWHTAPEAGLTDRQAAKNREAYGPNLLPESEPRSGWEIFSDQFKSLPVALLGAAAGLSVVTGGLVDAVLIMGVVVINAAIGYKTESESEKVIQSLHTLVRPVALARRQGGLKEISGEDVVPGDLVVLRPGSYVPADAVPALRQSPVRGRVRPHRGESAGPEIHPGPHRRQHRPGGPGEHGVYGDPGHRG